MATLYRSSSYHQIVNAEENKSSEEHVLTVYNFLDEFDMAVTRDEPPPEGASGADSFQTEARGDPWGAPAANGEEASSGALGFEDQVKGAF